MFLLNGAELKQGGLLRQPHKADDRSTSLGRKKHCRVRRLRAGISLANPKMSLQGVNCQGMLRLLMY